MKIGIDISQIVYEGTGVSRYMVGFVNTVLDLDKKNEWVFYYCGFNRKLDPKLKIEIKKKGFKLFEKKIPPTFLSLINNSIHNSYLSSIVYPLSPGLDWFITSDWTEPPLNCKKATVVHDLAYLRHPETVAKTIFETQKKRLHHIKKETDIVVTDSDATKNDLIDLLQFDPLKIQTIYPGVENIKTPSDKDVKTTLKKYGLKRKFILSVGKLEPRKNIKRLIEAFQQFNNSKIDLVIVGPKGWDEQLINEMAKQSNIKFLGYINNPDLYSLYSSCLFFIYPSLWEGFGYPLVEAMQLGIPMTCSNTSSMSEVADSAALFFDPLNKTEIIKSIDELVKNVSLRNQLAEKGRKQSAKFSWKNYYNTLIDTLEQFGH